MRFTVRDLMWLTTGLAIAFAVLGSLWRHEYATWAQERAALRSERAALEANVESQRARAALAERNLKGLYQDLQDPAVLKEIAVTVEADPQFKRINLRTPSSK